jgi:hypothetical protein
MPGGKPSVMMLILQARPLDLNGLDRRTKTYLTQWYMFIGRQGPPNACFTNTKADGGPPYRSTLAHWSDPQDRSTVHVTMDRSLDDGHELTLDVHGANVRGQIVHDAANSGEFNGVERTVEGARIGPPDPTLGFTAAKPVAAAVIR